MHGRVNIRAEDGFRVRVRGSGRGRARATASARPGQGYGSEWRQVRHLASWNISYSSGCTVPARHRVYTCKG